MKKILSSLAAALLVSLLLFSCTDLFEPEDGSVSITLPGSGQSRRAISDNLSYYNVAVFSKSSFYDIVWDKDSDPDFNRYATQCELNAVPRSTIQFSNLDEGTYYVYVGAYDSNNKRIDANISSAVNVKYGKTATTSIKLSSDNKLSWLYSYPIDASTGKMATIGSTYVYFGWFPQTVLPSTSTVTVDETSILTMGGNTYYHGSDGNYYIKATSTSNSYTYTDGSAVTNGESRYFKVEPIKWRVLTTDYNGTGKALLLAEDFLKALTFYATNTSTSYGGSNQGDRTIDGTTVYANNYKYSQLRAYLNGLDYYYYDGSSTVTKTDYNEKGFLQTAFTSTAQNFIATTTVDNSAATTADTGGNIAQATSYVCDNTRDKLFLLSEYEATTEVYGFNTYNTADDNRLRIPTDYARITGPYQNGGSIWWLRSPYSGSSVHVNMCTVTHESKAIYKSGYTDNTGIGIVPAMTISFY